MIFSDKSDFNRVFAEKTESGLNFRAYLLLFLLCMALYLPGFFTVPPVDRDEPFFAQATKQMLETGNYLEIKFQDETRYKKPIGIYWLQAAAVKMAGAGNMDEIWAYRLPSLFGATAAVMLTAATGALLFGPMAGMIAAMLLAMCAVMNVEARLAKADAALLAFIMAAQYALAKAYAAAEKGDRSFHAGNFLVFWASLAAGFLVKGPIVMLPPAATILGLRFAGKRKGWTKPLKPALGIFLFVALASPWFVYIINANGGDVVQSSLRNDLLGKIFRLHVRGFMPPGLHLLAMPFVFFPASYFAIVAALGAWKNRREDGAAFCLSWALPTWILFELVPTKLPHYVLPAYPAIAILAAAFVAGYWDKDMRECGKTRRAAARVPYFAAISAAFVAVIFGAVAPSLDDIWLSRKIVEAAKSVKPCAELKLVSAPYNEPSLVFLAGTNTRFDYEEDAAKAAETLKNDKCFLALIDQKREAAFISHFDDGAVSRLYSVKTRNLGNMREIGLSIYALNGNKRMD